MRRKSDAVDMSEWNSSHSNTDCVFLSILSTYLHPNTLMRRGGEYVEVTSKIPDVGKVLKDAIGDSLTFSEAHYHFI